MTPKKKYAYHVLVMTQVLLESNAKLSEEEATHYAEGIIEPSPHATKSRAKGWIQVARDPDGTTAARLPGGLPRRRTKPKLHNIVGTY